MLGLEFFSRKSATRAKVLIDIGAETVAGAISYEQEGQVPVLLYVRRLPIEGRRGEAHHKAMLRALAILGDALVREGAPVLARTTGSGTPDAILVSVDAPWQTTSVRTEHFEGNEPFTFTKALVDEALAKAACAVPGKRICDESIVGALLNGYATHQPYGKKVHRAAVVVLSSLIEEPIAVSITETLSALYHTKRITLISGSSLRYQAIRTAFPHEHDLLILDATGPVVSLSLVRRDLLVALSEEEDGGVGSPKWVKEVSAALDELSKQNPLPHTIFLLSRESDTMDIEKTLADAKLGSLWLSDNPPKIVPILPSHLAAVVRQADSTLPDLPLLLIAVYADRNGLVY